MPPNNIVELTSDHQRDFCVRVQLRKASITQPLFINNLQLIDASNGCHIWAERFDRQLEDLFTNQDEITEEIVTAQDVKLVAGESV